MKSSEREARLAWNTRAPLLSESELKNYVEAVRKIDRRMEAN